MAADPLLKAAAAGDVARLRQLVANGADLNACDPPLVNLAIQKGKPEVIKCLSELNAPMRPFGGLPLAMLALCARTEEAGVADPGVVISVLAALRDAGVDLDRSSGGGTVLRQILDDTVIANISFDASRAMRGADARRRPTDVTHWQHDGTVTTKKTWWTMEARLAVAQWLLEAGVDPDGGSELSPGFTCAMCGNLDGLKLLRSHGADLSKPSRISDSGPAHSVVFAALVRDAKHVVRWLSKECGIVPTRAELADAHAERERYSVKTDTTGGRTYAVARLCGYCGRTGATQQCGKCGKLGPRFCDRSCFKRAWKSHKRVCGTDAGKDREPLLVELTAAVFTGDVAAIERLVREDKVPVDADISHITGDSSTNRRAVQKSQEDEKNDPLAKQGFSVGHDNSACMGAETALLQAAFFTPGPVMKKILHGIFPDWSPARKRLVKGYDSAKVIRCLAALGADLERRTTLDDYKLTAVHVANRSNNLEGLSALAAAGSDMNAKTGFDGSSPVHQAAIICPLSTMRRLVALGCDVDQVDNYGRYPIRVAVEEGRVDIVECLAEAGAHAPWPMLHDIAQWHPVLGHHGKREATLKCLDRLSMRARGKPASAAMPEAMLREGINAMMHPPAAGLVHARQWASQLAQVDGASVAHLRRLIKAAGGSDRGCFEKSELRERAREVLSAKVAEAEASAATPADS